MKNEKKRKNKPIRVYVVLAQLRLGSTKSEYFFFETEKELNKFCEECNKCNLANNVLIGGVK